MSTMKEIVGKTIRNLRIADQETHYTEAVLLFGTDDGDMAFVTDADCCSETWFADIVGVEALIGGTVAAAEDIDLPEPQDGRTRQDYDQAYGVKITTDKGVCDIVYRNSSNGYYGGWCSFSPAYSGATNERQITEDWSA